MRKVIPILLILVFVLVGCEYSVSQLPEKVCIKADNFIISNNGSMVNVEEGQVEIQLNGCPEELPLGIMDYAGIKFDTSNNRSCLFIDKDNNTVFFAMQVCGGQFGWDSSSTAAGEVSIARCGFECNPNLPPEKVNFDINLTEQDIPDGYTFYWSAS